MIKWVEIIKENLKHHFVRDVAILQVGTIASTGLGFIASLVMARVFKPDLYGEYVLIFSLVGLIGLFMNVGSGDAATTLLAEAYNKKDRESILGIIAYFFKISSLTFIIVGLLGIILSPFLAEILYHQALIGQWARVILFSNIFLLGFSFYSLVLQVVRKITQYTILENINKLAVSFLIILAVVFGLGVWGAVVAQLAVTLIFAILAYYWYRKFQTNNQIFPTWLEIASAVFSINKKKYFLFGFQIAMDKNIVNFRSFIPTIAMGYLLASSEVAFYRIAFSYISLSTLLVSPISYILNIQLPKTKIFGLSSLKKRFFQTALISGVISSYLTLFFLMIAPFLIKLFYGNEYLPTLPAIYILAVNFAVSGFGVGLGAIFRTLNKMKYPLIINGIVVSLSILPAYILIKDFGMVGAAWWVTVVNVITIAVDFIVLNILFKKTGSLSV